MGLPGLGCVPAEHSSQAADRGRRGGLAVESRALVLRLLLTCALAPTMQNFLALVPLALLLGEVTEDLALRFGDVIGGLLVRVAAICGPACGGPAFRC